MENIDTSAAHSATSLIVVIFSLIIWMRRPRAQAGNKTTPGSWLAICVATAGILLPLAGAQIWGLTRGQSEYSLSAIAINGVLGLVFAGEFATQSVQAYRNKRFRSGTTDSASDEPRKRKPL